MPRITLKERETRRKMAGEILDDIAAMQKDLIVMHNAVSAMTEDEGMHYFDVAKEAARKVKNASWSINNRFVNFFRAWKARVKASKQSPGW